MNYDHFYYNGALGELLGAGGGGFMIFYFYRQQKNFEKIEILKMCL